MKPIVCEDNAVNSVSNLSVILPTTLNAELSINLAAIKRNWCLLQSLAEPAQCAAVVKANAYGLGDSEIVKALSEAGCRAFFVATVEEAISISGSAEAAQIVVLNGVGKQDLAECQRRGYIPVLSTLEQIADWHQANASDPGSKSCVIQVDTGMNRLGLNPDEWVYLIDHYKAAALAPQWVMSHLACAEDCGHPLNQTQLQRFQAIVAQAQTWCPGIKASFANSSGVCLGADYHFQQVRTGIAVYGGNPELNRANRFEPVVRLRLPILQLRRVAEDGSVGYGATAQVKAGSVLATVHSGYADGLLIAQSKTGWGEINGVKVPLLGRISMDLTIFDVSAVPTSVWEDHNPHYIDVLNKTITIDDMAEAASTISYEILTRLGSRLKRRYVEL